MKNTLLTLLLALLCSRVYSQPSAARLWLHASEECLVDDVPVEQQCEYVKQHDSACSPRGGVIDYPEIYYCYLQNTPILAVVTLLLWLGLVYTLLFVACDRFFCPSLELISQYLKLSPAVAGATLLAFGNGAPDIFTQLSAIASGSADDAADPEAVGMALSEPLGGGLFVSNVVLGLVVLIASGRSGGEVVLQPKFFLKDIAFYLAAVSLVLCTLLVGEVHLWQCLLLLCLYTAYVAITLLLSRGQRVFLDPRLHEVPRLIPHGPWDDLDSDEAEDWEQWDDGAPEGAEGEESGEGAESHVTERSYVPPTDADVRVADAGAAISAVTPSGGDSPGKAAPDSYQRTIARAASGGLIADAAAQPQAPAMQRLSAPAGPPGTLHRSSSTRSTASIVSLVRKVSNRYKYRAPPAPATGDEDCPLGGSLPQHQHRHSAAEELFVPLLLEGRLQELGQALGAANSSTHSNRHGSATPSDTHSLYGGSPGGGCSLGSSPPGILPGGCAPPMLGGSRNPPSPPVPMLTEAELAEEAKRLKKLLTYGLQQQRRERQQQQPMGTSPPEAGAQGQGLPASAVPVSLPLPAQALGLTPVSGEPGDACITVPAHPALVARRLLQHHASDHSGASFQSWASPLTGAEDEEEGECRSASSNVQCEEQQQHQQQGSKSVAAAGGFLRSKSRLDMVTTAGKDDDDDLTLPLLQPRSEDAPTPGKDGVSTHAAGVAQQRCGPQHHQHHSPQQQHHHHEGDGKGVDLVGDEHSSSRGSVGHHVWRLIRRTITVIMSLTMPAMEHSQHIRYERQYAVLLPLVLPLVIATHYCDFDPLTADWLRDTRLHAAALACAAAAALVYRAWPADNVLSGRLLAACTVMSFVGSMAWMSSAADELVNVLIAVGRILDLPSQLLGATVLAWGNSMSDTVSNLTMARDGYPTMAITACFASPLFTLLAGVASTLTYGARGGSLLLPRDPPILVLYGAACVNLAAWGALIPAVFRYRLGPRTALCGLAFYAIFQAVYIPVIFAS